MTWDGVVERKLNVARAKKSKTTSAFMGAVFAEEQILLKENFCGKPGFATTMGSGTGFTKTEFGRKWKRKNGKKPEELLELLPFFASWEGSATAWSGCEVFCQKRTKPYELSGNSILPKTPPSAMNSLIFANFPKYTM
ncbi:hypothetical protein Aduo_003019 [Ancylostoma duodenale]